MCPSALLLSNHFPQRKMVVTPLAVLVTSTRSSSQPGFTPVLSCSSRTFCSSPMSNISSRNLSVRPRSKRLRNFWRSWRRPESPLEPWMVMKTLASVPAPFSSPVMTMISYLTGTRLRALLAKLSMDFVHSNVRNSSLFGDKGIRALQLKMYLEVGTQKGQRAAVGVARRREGSSRSLQQLTCFPALSR